MTVDDAGMLAAIAARFPACADLPFQWVDSGWDCRALAVGSLIFKFPRHWAAAAALRQEARLLQLVRQTTSLPVPDLQIEDGPVQFSWHHALPGGHLLAGDYAGLPAEARDALAGRLARFLADVHAIALTAAREAGAGPVEAWLPPAEVAAGLFNLAEGKALAQALALLDQAAALGPDPTGKVLGQFDGHGWNIAFDRQTQTLNGIYDFGDAGIGDRHRDFIYSSLISFDLTWRIADAYERRGGLALDRNRIAVLAGWHRLWESVTEKPSDRADMAANYQTWRTQACDFAKG